MGREEVERRVEIRELGVESVCGGGSSLDLFWWAWYVGYTFDGDGSDDLVGVVEMPADSPGWIG